MMNDRNHRIRKAFRDLARIPVKITPDGFEIEDDSFDDLVGRVAILGLSRKLFDGNSLVCSSTNGILGTDGRTCDLCLHPLCQPRLRIQLVSEEGIYLLELATSSARNLFSMEDMVALEGLQLWDCLLRLTIIDRGYWGEVCFEKIPDFNRMDKAQA